MLIVAALGGNALLLPGEPLTAAAQRAHLRDAGRALGDLAGRGGLLVTHGNGPQVGWLAALHADAAPPGAMPLDVIGAESDAMIGYLVAEELTAATGRDVVTLLTRVEVDPDDPAWAHPTKPIGPWVERADAEALADRLGWTYRERQGRWRRVVPSPRPQRIVEEHAISALLAAGHIVVCAGGGGIPVAREHGSPPHGVEAVIDKDATSALLARTVGAELLLLLTDVDAVYRGFGTTDAQRIASATPAELETLSLDPGSMAPKVAAACEFVRATGRRAGIGALADGAAIADGRAGTLVHPDHP